MINYAKNPKKTKNLDYATALYEDLEEVVRGKRDNRIEKLFYVSGVNVDPETAYESMCATRELNDRGNILAFHLMQSFAPGETTPEICHEIGVKLAERLWGSGSRWSLQRT